MKTISKKSIFTIGLVVVVLLSCQQLLADKEMEVKLLDDNRIKFITHRGAGVRGVTISDLDDRLTIAGDAGGAIDLNKLTNEVTNTLNLNAKNEIPIFSIVNSEREIIMSDADILLKNRLYLVFVKTNNEPEDVIFCIKSDTVVITGSGNDDAFIKRCHKESLP
ncbi:hypothetical protein [Hydromonas duriensis]|uniref:Uncharacterized protein n=1 Tax=Hydromonas duriensis TaxID=1527608 RepID=A0A4R6Y486_9BURK|nr:hypothetical protein [Hydromonas duriensis]TDR27016.1 hypothetical protein DFR44_1564 [Hydromonas duriensis]